jgi:hypothetical protein
MLRKLLKLLGLGVRSRRGIAARSLVRTDDDAVVRGRWDDDNDNGRDRCGGEDQRCDRVMLLLPTNGRR